MCIMPFGSYLAQHNWNPKLIILMGEAVALTSFTLAAFMENFTAFVIFYVIGFGSQNFVYMAPIHNVWLWFPSRPGLVSGIIIGGYGLGALIFDNVSTFVINPDNLPIDEATGRYPESVNQNFRKMFSVFIAMWIGLTLIGIASVFRGPQPADRKLVASIEDERMQLRSNDALNPSAFPSEDSSLTHADLAEKEKLVEEEVTLQTMVFTKQFILLFVMNLFSICSGFFAINNFKAYG